MYDAFLTYTKKSPGTVLHKGCLEMENSVYCSLCSILHKPCAGWQICKYRKFTYQTSQKPALLPENLCAKKPFFAAYKSPSMHATGYISMSMLLSCQITEVTISDFKRSSTCWWICSIRDPSSLSVHSNVRKRALHLFRIEILGIVQMRMLHKVADEWMGITC